MTPLITRQKQAEELLATALRQLNGAIHDVHKSGLDVEISTLTIHTPRGPMVQVDLHVQARRLAACSEGRVVKTGFCRVPLGIPRVQVSPGEAATFPDS
ncbi:hypothetical protein [Rhizobium sp. Leaf311]|uniref:hypothetical protein n=1 Tax=Rhizobium sp. Leaf311 TaxID=1736332 RepID=UPI000AEB8233|nr:hypothetical protein [Rhizobium sp. Leaf311]